MGFLLDEVSMPVRLLARLAYDRDASSGFVREDEWASRRDVVRRAAIEATGTLDVLRELDNSGPSISVDRVRDAESIRMLK